MAVVDMPLEQLRDYMGINPCPDDFDAYWDAALNEMRQVDADIEISPSPFKTSYADCFDLYFTGVRGARVYSKLLIPKDIKQKCPALVSFHGYTGASGDWTNYLPYAAQGFVVAAMDCRGQGGRSQDTSGVLGTTFGGLIVRGLDDAPENLYFRHVFLDTAQLACIVMGMDQVDPDRVGAFGGSQGGALTLACAALVPEIKKIASVFPFLSDYKRVWELDVETSAYREIRDFFRRFDPLHEREDTLFKRLGYIDVHLLARRVHAHTLMALCLRDDICPPSTQFAAYNNLAAPKQNLFFPDYGHEHLPGLNDRIFEFLADI